MPASRILILPLFIFAAVLRSESEDPAPGPRSVPVPVDANALANLVGGDSAEAPDLGLSDAMRLGIENNYNRKISREEVASARAGVDQARGPVLPQVAVGLDYRRVNDDQSAVQSGFSPRSETSLNLSASQMIYDDSRVTGLRTSRRDLDAARESDASVELDVAAEVGFAYVRVLSIASSLRIAEDNLRITRENLDLAKIRREVGTAGPEEVLRFESEEAQQESRLWSERSLLHEALNDLNRALGEPPDRSWNLEDLSLDTPVFDTSLRHLIPLAHSRESSEAFRRTSIEMALARAPELAAVGFSSEAERLRLAESRRSFLVPDIVAEFEYSHIVDSEYSSGALGASEEDDSWTFLLGASLPLFEGGSRLGDVRRSRAGLRRLGWEDARLRQQIAVNVSNTLSAMASSWQSIRLSRIAAERAEQNLSIVQDKYEQGTVSIIDLLDAQNNALVQRQTASIELYRFFQDLLSFQRALSWIEPASDPESAEEILARFRSAVR
ncbi:MAG: TolC family protein [Puniceicoccaceae bacterium]